MTVAAVHELRRIPAEDGRDAADVTVVVPTIPGREELLQRALLSASAQLRPARFIYVVNDYELRGAAFARNLGLFQVETEWVAWLDDDDELLPNHLEVLLDAAEAEGADLAYSCMEVVGGKNPLAVVDDAGAWVDPCGVSFNEPQRQHLVRRGNFIPVTYLVRTSRVIEAGGFPGSWTPECPRPEEDHCLLLALLKNGARFAHAPHVTWRYHMHDGNTGGGTDRFRGR